MVKIGIIGDIHREFALQDIEYFNRSDYDLLLFVGDLGNWWPGEALQVAAVIRLLRKPALLIPGNHDTVTAFQLLAEIRQSKLFSRLFALGHNRRASTLQQHLGNVTWAGYSTHSFNISGHQFDVVAGRPLSLGGSGLDFRPFLSDTYAVDSIAKSSEKLRLCVDAAASSHLIFLAHNGPTGLGATRSDIWGRDFHPKGGDHGDDDLRQAIEYARHSDYRIVAVVAGHMHQQLSGGGQRRWLLEKEGVLYINAARVPRVASIDGQLLRHHVRLTFDGQSATAIEMLV